MRLSLWCLGAALLLPAASSADAQAVRPSGDPVRVLTDGTPALHPVWSPDGSQLAFTRPQFQGIWIADADGSDPRQVTDAPSAGYGFSWAPDGSAILARTARYDGPQRLNAVVVFDLATGEAQALTDEQAQMPSLPQWAGAASVALPTAGAVDVLAVDPDAAVRTAPTGTVVTAQNETVVVTDLATGVRRTVTPIPGATLLNVTPSPDGLRVAFEVMGGTLHTMNVDGTGLTDLGLGHRPSWSPDGRWIAFMVTEDDGETFTASDLYAARADGSARVALTQTPDRLEMNPSWSPDGGRIAFDDLADGALYVLPVTE